MGPYANEIKNGEFTYIENLNSQNLYEVFSDNNQIFIFENRIKEEFEMKKRANLNEIESNLPFGKKWEKNRLRYNEINVGSSLDHNFVLETIVTTTSIIISQKSTTKLRLHFSVVNNFKPRDMIKIYSLRNRLVIVIQGHTAFMICLALL